MQIESQRHEFLERIDELEERAEIAEQKARTYQSKFVQIKEQPSKESYRQELKDIVQRQKLLEATNRQLQAEALMLEEGLSDLTVNEQEYGDITIKPKSQRTIKGNVLKTIFILGHFF